MVMDKYETKDSGHRVEFRSGMRRDAALDKIRYDLLIPLAAVYFNLQGAEYVKEKL